MATIRQFQNKVRLAQSYIPQMVQDIVERLKEEIIDLNRMEQLFLGKDSEGNTIGVYSVATEKLFGGAEKGKIAGEPYNFEDTGDLFSSYGLEYNNGKIEIFNTDSKVELLKEKYEKGRGKLFKLTWEHEMEFNYEILMPELAKSIRNIIYAK